jgi:hypothetical protein
MKPEEKKARGIVKQEVLALISSVIELLNEETLYDLQDEQADCGFEEIYEYWIVTEWLAERLREQGHFVFELGWVNVWGRPTTGQAIYMDAVMERIALEVLA